MRNEPVQGFPCRKVAARPEEKWEGWEAGSGVQEGRLGRLKPKITERSRRIVSRCGGGRSRGAPGCGGLRAEGGWVPEREGGCPRGRVRAREGKEKVVW